MSERSLQSPGQTSAAPGLVASGAVLIAVTYGIVRFGYGLQLPQLTAEFDLTPGVAGAIAAGSFAAYCLAALSAQRLIARRGARAVLWLAAALAASGSGLVAVSWSTPALALGVLVGGSAAGAASPALVVAVGSTVRGSLVARAQGMVNAGTGAGVAVAGVAVLAAPQAWRPIWWVAAAAALGVAALVDRLAHWPAQLEHAAPSPRDTADLAALMWRPVGAAVVAGVGSAAVWTFGRDLVTTTGGLSERTTAALWVVLGVAAVLGAFSGDAVRLLGLRHAWMLTACLTAAGTAVLALAPGQVAVAALAGALFGGAYTALSGVLIAWASAIRPDTAGQATASLFVALTAGQAVGAVGAGSLAGATTAPTAFLASAVLLLGSAALAPSRSSA